MLDFDQKDAPSAEEPALCVLKFGSSVLEREADYAAAAAEVYRHVRAGEKVIAVVSALAGETDALLAQSAAVGGAAPDRLVARLARVGELKSAALMALALARIGVRASALDPDEMKLQAEGEALDADLVSLDAGVIDHALQSHEVVVAPGFCAVHEAHGVVTLGRGGTDLTAVFFAAQTGARRVRLIKDVDGVYAEDPAKNPNAERFAELDYDAAARASSGLIQPKAIEAAKQAGVVIEVAALGAGDATRIAAAPARKAPAHVARPLRVALLGCGAVGAGVLAHLRQRADLFEMNPVLVRNPAKHAAAGVVCTDRLDRALSGGPDLVVEVMGGADEPAHIMSGALQAGAAVVTANKAAVAKHYDSLHAAARASGAALRFSAAVGGGTPILELLEQLADGPGVASAEGVMNGTGNFILSKLGEGAAFDDALAEAQALGFAEADPSADVEGHDAADKLSLVIRAAFGVELAPDAIAKQSLDRVGPEQAQNALARGEIYKQIASCRLAADGSVEACVEVRPVPFDHPLAGARNEENRLVALDRSGRRHALYGKGAGRWPTAAAVFADIMDVQRAFAASAQARLAPPPVLKRA
ncbi:MAG: homoserine dehydrogenase [Pseudomonadota bacterium]